MLCSTFARSGWVLALAALLLTACVPSAPAVLAAATVSPIPAATATPIAPPTLTAAPSATLAPTPTPTAVFTPTAQALGPDEFPAGVNPLTGLPVQDPALLQLPPALVSISNSPVTARPQAGLSFSPVVHEIFIGAGKTRFLATFYGDFPRVRSDRGDWLPDDEVSVGPIRSGRLPYETLRQLYNGFVVMAFASKWVMPNLTFYHNIISPDLEDINATRVSVADLKGFARSRLPQLGAPAISGHRFDPAPPPGGKPAPMIWIPFAYYDQIIWRYDAASGAYNRYQDREDAEHFDRITDSLTGEPLTFENVVVIFADYISYRETLVDVPLQYITRYPALAFRDGQIYRIWWTTGNEAYEQKTGKLRPIRFKDAQGIPFPLKPGQTWLELVPQNTNVFETVDSTTFFDLANKPKPGSGNWAVLFIPPVPQEPSE